MNTLVVYCHPEPASYTAAVLERTLTALHAAGDDVRVTDLYAEGFDPVLDADGRRHHLEPGAAPDVQHHANDLMWCQRLVLVYPTWWSGQPAMLKGWIDRVWVRGVAWDLPPGANRIRAKLRNVRQIVVVTTHGSSKFVNAVEGEIGKRTVGRMLRSLCNHRAKVRWIALYGIDTASDVARERFLERVSSELGRS